MDNFIVFFEPITPEKVAREDCPIIGEEPKNKTGWGEV
jgi:hypothetical protein